MLSVELVRSYEAVSVKVHVPMSVKAWGSKPVHAVLTSPTVVITYLSLHYFMSNYCVTLVHNLITLFCLGTFGLILLASQSSKVKHFKLKSI